MPEPADPFLETAIRQLPKPEEWAKKFGPHAVYRVPIPAPRALCLFWADMLSPTAPSLATLDFQVCTLSWKSPGPIKWNGRVVPPASFYWWKHQAEPIPPFDGASYLEELMEPAIPPISEAALRPLLSCS